MLQGGEFKIKPIMCGFITFI